MSQFFCIFLPVKMVTAWNISIVVCRKPYKAYQSTTQAYQEEYLNRIQAYLNDTEDYL